MTTRLQTKDWQIILDGDPTTFETRFARHNETLPPYSYSFGWSTTTDYQLKLRLWEASYESYQSILTPSQWFAHIGATLNPLLIWYDYHFRITSHNAPPPTSGAGGSI